MPDFRVGERVRITNVRGAHPSWLGMEGEIQEFIGRFAELVIRAPGDAAHDNARLRFEIEYLQSVDQDHAEALRVLGEEYFA